MLDSLLNSRLYLLATCFVFLTLFFSGSSAAESSTDRLFNPAGKCIRESHLEEHYVSDYFDRTNHVRGWQPEPSFFPTLAERVGARSLDALTQRLARIDRMLGSAEERYDIYRGTLREWYETETQRRRLGGTANRGTQRHGRRIAPRDADVDVILNLDLDLQIDAGRAVVLPFCSSRKR